MVSNRMANTGSAGGRAHLAVCSIALVPILITAPYPFTEMRTQPHVPSFLCSPEPEGNSQFCTSLSRACPCTVKPRAL